MTNRHRTIALLTAAVAAIWIGSSWPNRGATAESKADERTDRQTSESGGEPKKDSMSSFRYQRPSETEIRESLTDLQFRVTQHDATEPPFSNRYWSNKEPGIYVDVVSGEPLFSSLDKFNSGTGWPSFTKPIKSGHVIERADHKLGWPRTEVRSKFGDSHLGHVFSDGPDPTGLRYCINSAALRFVPESELEAQGYGRYADQFDAGG